MPTYKTPNVYVEEVSTLPPSVVPVATAIPAFIGCTEKAGNSNQYRYQPVRISSILDYTTLFGEAAPTEFTVTVKEETVNGQKNEQITNITRGENSKDTPDFLMYYALRLFFENGGGACYIVSVGDYSETQPSKDDFNKGLAAIRQEDEPTLLVLTDGVNLNSVDYYALCGEVLKQCNDLKDRFGIFDILASDGKTPTKEMGSEFRQNIGNNHLKYGAAYYPYLQTALNYYYTDQSVTIQGVSNTNNTEPSNQIGEYLVGGEKGLKVTYNGSESDNPRLKITLTNRQSIAIENDNGVLTIHLPSSGATVKEITDAATTVGNYRLSLQGVETTRIDTALEETKLVYPVSELGTKLEQIKTQKTELYNIIKTALNGMRVVMPPSGAVAGIYATIDRERGVWKAPANVSIASVIAPTVKITNEDQENLNIDVTSGKSINAIRSFTGKGTLIWGARTLAGNDNEWRYISVRRLFNLIEESVQKATAFAVFESNNAITWLKIKTLISSYLEGLWRQGALAGATAEQAFFVNVGLGQTMTTQDILEGRMIVEIGIAAVRPAEFIILRFSHKLQES